MIKAIALLFIFPLFVNAQKPTSYDVNQDNSQATYHVKQEAKATILEGKFNSLNSRLTLSETKRLKDSLSIVDLKKQIATLQKDFSTLKLSAQKTYVDSVLKKAIQPINGLISGVSTKISLADEKNKSEDSSIIALGSKINDVKTLAENAAKKDTISGLPGQIVITKLPPSNYNFSISPEIIQKIAAIEVKLIKAKIF